MLMSKRPLAMRLETMSAVTGVPKRDSLAKALGKRPLLATAWGSWPCIRIQPLSAPKQEMSAVAAMR